MRFINQTRETKKVRINSDQNASGYDWLTIKVGEYVNISESYGRALGFDRADQQDAPEAPKQAAKNQPNAPTPNPKVTKESRDQFFKDLCKIKGIGKKTAEDILGIYLTKEDLKADLDAGNDVPIRDDLADALKEAF